LVYTKQLKMKLESQRKIYNYLLRKKGEYWASWTELLKAKEIGLSKRALSRNLKEMLKPNSELRLIKEKRPFDPHGFRLEEMHRGAGIFKGVLKEDADYIKDRMVKRFERFRRNHSAEEIVFNPQLFERIIGKNRFYRRKRYLKILKKYFRQFERIGYSIKRPDIIHGGDLKDRPTDGSDYSIMRAYKDEKGNLVGRQFFRKLVKKTKG